MPRSRKRGGSRMPRAGDDTTFPPMLISPEVGCSRPATQRKVVVLPQPDGPSSTTISPAGTAKLTPSTAGRPIANCLRRSVTSSVPISNPWPVQLHILVELRVPDLDDLGIEAFGIGGRVLQ